MFWPGKEDKTHIKAILNPIQTLIQAFLKICLCSSLILPVQRQGLKTIN